MVAEVEVVFGMTNTGLSCGCQPSVQSYPGVFTIIFPLVVAVLATNVSAVFGVVNRYVGGSTETEEILQT